MVKHKTSLLRFWNFCLDHCSTTCGILMLQQLVIRFFSNLKSCYGTMSLIHIERDHKLDLA